MDLCALSRCWVVNAVSRVVFRGKSQAQWRMRNLCWLGRAGVSGLNVELQEAEASRVAYLGCVIDRGRIGRLRRDTFPCPGRVSSGSGESGWLKRPGGMVAWGRTFEEAVKFVRLRRVAERCACWWIRGEGDMLIRGRNILANSYKQNNRSVASNVVSWSAEVIATKICWQRLVIHRVLGQCLATEAEKRSDTRKRVYYLCLDCRSLR